MKLTNLMAVVAIASATFTATAQQISADAAMRSAQRHLMTTKSLKSTRNSTEKLSLVYTAPNTYNEDENCFYVFNRENGGFVIAGADECATPVLATIDEGSFDLENIPDNAKWWLEKCQAQISEAIMEGAAADASAPALAQTQTSTERQSIQPLVSTKWSQSAPYNALCKTSSGESAPGGCVAVALAQILNYHQWPTATLNGSYNPGFWQFTFTDLTFDWANMPQSISTSSPQEQIDAISTLIYNCGIMIGSSYSTYITSAKEERILEVLWKCMDYSTGISYRDRNMHRTCEWEDIIINELKNGRPVLYTGGEADRHAFVCDGYNAEDNTFHMNWGWGGIFNGYYSITPLVLEKADMRFNSREHLIINIKPSTQGNEMDTPLYCTGNVLGFYQNTKIPELSYIKTDGKFTTLADHSYLYMNRQYDFFVDIAIKAVDIESGEEIFIKSNDKIAVTGDDSASNLFGSFNVNKYLTCGRTYDVTTYYKESTLEEWKPVVFKYNATKVWRLSRLEDGSYECTSAMSEAKLNVTSMRTYNAVTGANLTIDADIENTGDANYLGTLSVSLVDSEGNSALTLSKEIDVPGKTTQTVTFEGSLADVSKGNYSLVASDESAATVSNGYTVTVASNIFTGIDDVEASKFAINVNDSEIDVKASTEVKSIEVYNIAGQKVYSKSVDAQAATISISQFTQGVYVVKVIAQGEVAVKQFVKK